MDMIDVDRLTAFERVIDHIREHEPVMRYGVDFAELYRDIVLQSLRILSVRVNSGPCQVECDKSSAMAQCSHRAYTHARDADPLLVAIDDRQRAGRV